MWLIARASQSWKSQITDLLLSKIEFDTSFLRSLGIIFPTCTLEHQCQPICYINLDLNTVCKAFFCCGHQQREKPPKVPPLNEDPQHPFEPLGEPVIHSAALGEGPRGGVWEARRTVCRRVRRPGCWPHSAAPSCMTVVKSKKSQDCKEYLRSVSSDTLPVFECLS